MLASVIAILARSFAIRIVPATSKTISDAGRDDEQPERQGCGARGVAEEQAQQVRRDTDREGCAWCNQ